MKTSSQAIPADADLRRLHKPEPAAPVDSSLDPTDLSNSSEELGHGSIEGQAARLSDPRLHAAQRQAAAAQIGAMQGNLHLQKAIRAIGSGGTSDAYEPPSLDWRMPLPPGGHMVQGSLLQREGTSTPLPKEAKKTKGGSAELKAGDATVVIKPDKTSEELAEGGETQFKVHRGKTPSYDIVDGKVTKVKGSPPKVQVEIQTVYAKGASPKEESAYGKGTTEEDIKAGKTSLEYHEGSHGEDYIQYLKNNPLPQFKAKAGMTVEEYQEAEATYFQEMDEYEKKMESHSKDKTDCVGTKATFCVEEEE